MFKIDILLRTHVIMLLASCILLTGCLSSEPATTAREVTQSKYPDGTFEDGTPGLSIADSVDQARSAAGFDSRIRDDILSQAVELRAGEYTGMGNAAPHAIIARFSDGVSLSELKWPETSHRTYAQWHREMTEGSKGEGSRSVFIGSREFLVFEPTEPPVYQDEDGVWHHEAGIGRTAAVVLYFDEKEQVSYLIGQDGRTADGGTLARRLAESIAD